MYLADGKSMAGEKSLIAAGQMFLRPVAAPLREAIADVRIEAG